MITHAQLLEFVHYNPDTGVFTLRKSTKVRAAGTVMNHDYIVIRRGEMEGTRQSRVMIGKSCSYNAGRLAWFYTTGKWPPHEIDHEDNDGWNQRWFNLRLATRSQNQANTRRYRSNTSGHKNVFLSDSKKNPWRVTIQKDGHRISIGRFDTKDAAIAAANNAARANHGDFARIS